MYFWVIVQICFIIDSSAIRARFWCGAVFGEQIVSFATFKKGVIFEIINFVEKCKNKN